MKKVEIITGYPLSETVITNRITPIAQQLQASGCDVEIATHSISAPVEMSVPVRRFPAFNYKSVPGVKRLVLEILNTIILLFREIFWRPFTSAKPNALIVSIPSMFLIFLSIFRRTGVVYILDVRDVTWEYLLKDSQSAKARAIRGLFIWATKRFHFITVTNDHEAEYFVQHGYPRDRIHLYYNGISRQKFDYLSSIDKSGPRPSDLAYAGNIGRAQNLVEVVGLMRRESLQNSSLDLIGDGVERAEIARQLESRKQDNVTLHGQLAWQDMIAALLNAKVIFVSLGGEYATAVPSKIYECLCLNRPIVFLGPKGACSDLLERFPTAYFVDVQSPSWLDELETLLCDLFANTADLDSKAFQSAAQSIETSFIRDENAKVFEQLVSE